MDIEPTRSCRYAIMSPVRNEEMNVEQTVKSVLSQTELPLAWVIVNDSSTDRTVEIINKMTAEIPWITLISKKRSDFAIERGPGIVESFYIGFNSLDLKAVDYVVKLDCDVEFNADFFERIFKKFKERPRLGICSGLGFERQGSRTVKMRVSDNSAFGATRVYRRQCFEEIGGLEHAWGWDGIDEIRADMLGWEVRTFDDIPFLHLKPHAAKNKFEHGVSAYIKGSHPLYVVVRGLLRMRDRPYIISGLALIWGFFSSYFKNIRKIDDVDFRKHVRKKEFARLSDHVAWWKQRPF